MFRKIDSKKMGKGNYGWLNTLYHFSFSNYYNPKNMNFGVLRVLNDDLITGESGFDTHPHDNMEIITYVIDGLLTHQDSMGNSSTINRGHVQYMSAGTGVTHSEENNSDKPLRLIQLWILPDQSGYKPNYGDYRFEFSDRVNKWLHMVSNKAGNAPIKINQDANIYSTYIDKDNVSEFKVESGRQAYLVLLEGKAEINGIILNQKDALEIIEEKLTIKANETSHVLLIEMAKE
ncbi:MAG: Pirin-related protein [Haloplasmataceae bacterium]|jgi:redox-sensitive bicupin YhaK (pirin superfamily)|nr:Pirin-related protein [Haloplasmataceae bacterium]